jgi:hypothetical protein
MLDELIRHPIIAHRFVAGRVREIPSIRRSGVRTICSRMRGWEEIAPGQEPLSGHGSNVRYNRRCSLGFASTPGRS